MDTDNTVIDTVDDHIQSEINENTQTPDDNDSVVRINAFADDQTLNVGMRKYQEEKTFDQIEKGVQTEWTPSAFYKDGMTRKTSTRVCNCLEASPNGTRCTYI